MPTLFGLELWLDPTVVDVHGEAYVAFPVEQAEVLLELVERRGPAAERLLRNQAAQIVLQSHMVTTATQAWARLEEQAADQKVIADSWKAVAQAKDVPFYAQTSWWAGIVIGALVAAGGAGLIIVMDN